MADWQIIDSHCHLDFPVFDAIRQQLVQSAQAAGVSHFVIPAVTYKDFQRVIDTASLYPHVSFALGLHPCFMQEHQLSDLEKLAEYIESQPVCAVGEIGLDFYLEGFDSVAQISLLKAQLKIAKEHQLPVLLHVRKAHDIMLKMLREMSFDEGGIVHAFSGSAVQAERYIQMGFKLGFGGVVTYPRANKIRHLAKTLPLNSIVLETDSPDMRLYGRQGEPNQPKYIVDVLKEVAGLRPESIETIAAITTANARRLLKLDGS
ncbi:TatD family hydrolase [Neptunomonas japonica]|uniref:TatD family hydrolase n=1 Tax=Neptunomonas japonica TaxID=417574 RepID=UPI00041F2967|nr:TatD family hydrolase [Neptunomonas japonica]